MAAEVAYRTPSETVATSMSRRFLALDVMRAVAVFLVLGSHALPPPDGMSELIRKPLQLWRYSGWIGIDVFLVLSGFLVSGILFRERMQAGRMHIGRFYLRRVFKIYPAMCFLVLVTVVVRAILGESLPFRQIFGEMVFMQNYVGALWGHTWFLAIIAHFYLLLPAALLIIAWWSRNPKDPFHAVPHFVLTICTLELAARVYMNVAYPYGPGSHLLVSHLRLDSLLFGVLLSYYYHFHAEAFVRFFHRWSAPFLILGCLLMGPMLILLQRDQFVVPTFGLVLVFLTIGVVLARLLISAFPRNRLTRALGYIGLHSYSIFLWHWATIDWFMEALHNLQVPWAVNVPAYMVINIAGGIALAKLIEFPVLRLRDKHWPASAGPLTRPDVAASLPESRVPTPKPAGKPHPLH